MGVSRKGVKKMKSVILTTRGMTLHFKNMAECAKHTGKSITEISDAMKNTEMDGIFWGGRFWYVDQELEENND